MQLKRPHYWSVYHNSRRYSDSRIFKVIRAFVNRTGSPWKVKRRGRKPKFSPSEHACICIYMVIRDKSYREIEAISESLFGKTIDHGTVGWAFGRLEWKYLEKVLKLIHDIIDCSWSHVFITDSTGIELDRYKVKITPMKFHIRYRRKRKFLKLHVIVKYFHEVGLLSIVSCKPTSEYRHDSPVFRSMFDENRCRNSLIFGDSAYFCCKNFELANSANSKLVSKNRFSPKFTSEHEYELYRKFRGVIEGTFGGIATKHGTKLRFRKDCTQDSGIVILAISHNIKTYIKMLETEKIVQKRNFYILILFFRQPPRLDILFIIH